MEKVAIYIRESNHSGAPEAIRRQEKKLSDFCEAKGYSVCDSASVIGDRKTSLPVLMNLLKSAKDKGAAKIIMASTNRVVGEADDIKAVNEAFVKSGLSLETLDGSHDAIKTPDLIMRTLVAIAEEEYKDN